MFDEELRPRGTDRSTQPSQKVQGLHGDPFSTCMKCHYPLSGVTKLPKTIDDLSIVLNCGHVLCNQCVHMNDYASVNLGRPWHCRHDFQCCICGLMSPPLTIPNHVKICSRRYTEENDGDCSCEICQTQNNNTKGQRKTLNNVAYCGIHSESMVKFFCFQCGKHLCAICVEQHKDDFDKDHTLTEISRENPKLEDALFHGAIIHGNLTSLEEEADRAAKDFMERSENMRNSMGCYFISIINAAIGRFCQLQSAIQLEEEKLKKGVKDVKSRIQDAKRRIEVGKELDDLARIKRLMPEQFVSDTYKMSAQKIFREAVVLHNKAIKDVHIVKSQNLHFNSKRPTDDVVRDVASVFSGFTMSNSAVMKYYELQPFTKLYSPSGDAVIDLPDKESCLKLSDFSTQHDAAIIKEDGFSRFKSAVAACGLESGNLSQLHPSLIPSKVKEKYLDARNERQNLSVYISSPTPATATAMSTPTPSSSVASTVHSPMMASPNVQQPAEDKSKKQEHLLSLIRGAAAAEIPATSAIVQELRKAVVVPPRTDGKRFLPQNRRYVSDSPAMPPVCITTRGSKYDRLRENLIAGNQDSEQVAKMAQRPTPAPPLPPPKPVSHQPLPLPKPQPQHNTRSSASQPSTSIMSAKDKMNISISSEFMTKLYNSAQFKSLSPDHQFYVLKQAQIMSEQEDQRKRMPNYSETDHIVILQINQVKLQTLITKLYNVEKSATAPNVVHRSLAKVPFHISTEPLTKLSSNSAPMAAQAEASPPKTTPTEVKQEMPAEEDVKPDVEELKRQMLANNAITIANVEEENKAMIIIEPPEGLNNCHEFVHPGDILMEPPPDTPFSPSKPVVEDREDGRFILRIPRQPKAAENSTDQSTPTTDECKQVKLELELDDEEMMDDNESVRTLDDDETHKWCYICNDDRAEVLEEEKGICTTCPRVFHKSCTIPRMRVNWSDDEHWQCQLCKTAPIKSEDDSKTLMTERNRFLCQTVLFKCFGTKRATLLMRSYADPQKTLAIVAKRLEDDCPNAFETVDQFIEAMNEVLINSSKHNPPSTEKGKGTKKVWLLFQKGIKALLPEYLAEVWCYVSLYGTSLITKRKSNGTTGRSNAKRRK